MGIMVDYNPISLVYYIISNAGYFHLELSDTQESNS